MYKKGLSVRCLCLGKGRDYFLLRAYDVLLWDVIGKLYFSQFIIDKLYNSLSVSYIDFEGVY